MKCVTPIGRSSRQAFELIPGEEEWYEIEGGHSGLLYHPCDRFDEANSVQADSEEPPDA